MLSPVPVVGLVLVQGHLDVGGVWATLQPCPGDGTPPSEDRLPGIPESLRHQSSAKGMLGEIPGRPVSAGSNTAPSASTTWIVSYPAGSF